MTSFSRMPAGNVRYAWQGGPWIVISQVQDPAIGEKSEELC